MATTTKEVLYKSTGDLSYHQQDIVWQDNIIAKIRQAEGAAALTIPAGYPMVKDPTTRTYRKWATGDADCAGFLWPDTMELAEAPGGGGDIDTPASVMTKGYIFDYKRILELLPSGEQAEFKIIMQDKLLAKGINVHNLAGIGQ